MADSLTEEDEQGELLRVLQAHIGQVAAPHLSRVEREILVALKVRGNLTAPEFALNLSVSASLVRHYLRRLQGEGLVSHSTVPTGRPGRRALRYVLDDRGKSLFPNLSGATGYAIFERFAQEDPDTASSYLREHLAFRLRREQILSEASSDTNRGRTPHNTAQFLARICSKFGYLPEVVERGHSVELVLNHCPFERLVRALPAFCELEHETLRLAVPGATSRRIAHPGAGDGECRYLFQLALSACDDEAAATG